MAEPEELEFDQAATEFVAAHQLAGCLVLVWPRERCSGKGNDGKPYDYVETDVIVLDGEPSTPLVTEVGPDSPILSMRFGGVSTVGSLKAQMNKPKSDKTGAYRPLLGRIDAKPSAANKQVMTCRFGEFNDADAALARKAAPRYAEHLASIDPFA